jgi:N-acetylmuramic acid 6-phosphate etherase
LTRVSIAGRLAVPGRRRVDADLQLAPDRLLLLIAGGRDALPRSVEGAEDASEHAVRLVQQHAVGKADALIAVAASGTTPFTRACLREATARGALTVGLANNRGTPILTDAHFLILLDTGCEPIAGSTA